MSRLYPNLNKDLKTRLQDAQNKFITFRLKISDRKSITVKEIQKINWLRKDEFTKGSINIYFLVYIYIYIYINFVQKKVPNYLDEIFSHAECRIPTRYSFQKLKVPHRKTSQDLRALSYIGL